MDAVKALLAFAREVDAMFEVTDGDRLCAAYNDVCCPVDEERGTAWRQYSAGTLNFIEYKQIRESCVDAMRAAYFAVQRLNARSIRAQLARQLEADRIAHIALVHRACAAAMGAR